MSDDDWVEEASGDATMVAELLLSFTQVKLTTAAAAPLPMPPESALSLEWTVRRRRSKTVMVRSKKQAPRASPTTPLSWSGATSISGVGGGGGGSGSGCGAYEGGPEEESSRPSSPPPPPKGPKHSDTPRSKVLGTSETTSTKKSRRKKTLAELKEEDDLLQKERRELKEELATLRLNLEKARVINENLKRMKLELQAPPVAESASIVASELAISDKLQQKIASFDPILAILPPIVARSLQSSPQNGGPDMVEKVKAGKFVLPDLNLPFEETEL